MSYLVLVRHGESRWNLANKFTGWVDVPLSENGVHEAIRTARDLKQIDFDVAFTSKLERAKSTLLIILSQQNRTGIFLHDEDKKRKYYQWTKHSNKHNGKEIPIHTSELLNERYYGALQGLHKDEAEQRYGKEKLFHWRRSYTGRPPKGETLKETFERMFPYYRREIDSLLKKNKNVLLAGHGNTLRAIMKYLEKIDDHDIPFLELPEGKPIIYESKRGKCVCLNPHEYSFERPLR